MAELGEGSAPEEITTKTDTATVAPTTSVNVTTAATTSGITTSTTTMPASTLPPAAPGVPSGSVLAPAPVPAPTPPAPVASTGHHAMPSVSGVPMGNVPMVC